MSNLLSCPIPEYTDFWIKLPDNWKGGHARRKDVAVQSASERKMGESLTEFAVAIAILDDWKLPGMNGNPDQWNFEDMPLDVISWVSGATLTPFYLRTAWRHPSYMGLLNRSIGSQGVGNQDGISDEEE